MIDDDAINLPDTVRDIVRLYLDQIALLTHKTEGLHSLLSAHLRTRANATQLHEPRTSAHLTGGIQFLLK